MATSDAKPRSSNAPKAREGKPGAHPEFPQVFGKYVLLRPMARGGMGELFLSVAGEVGGFEKLCVVKKVLGNLTDRTVHGRFLDEAKVVVRLNHSNLVQVFDAGSVDDEYYLTMELVEGKDLRAIWNRCAQLKRRIPVQFAISVIRDVCRGLEYVHNAGGLEMVHRDISPPNILVSYHGQVKITDFGLAKHTIKSEFTMPGVVYGRYSYLAPEQARGQAADRRSDIYAAGIVLWEMLTGRQMFPIGNNGRQVTELRALCNPTFVPPSKLVPGIPEGLDQVLARALAPEREDRYSQAEEFRHALKGVLSRHFPSYDLDRVSEFMRDIFEQERAFELEDYANYAREDFSSVRNATVRSVEEVSETEVTAESDVSTENPVKSLGTDSPAVEGLSSPSDAKAASPQKGEGPVAAVHATPLKPLLAPPPLTPKNQEDAALAAACQSRMGRVVNNRYRLDALIGIGAMGAVYVATHLGLEKRYAIKVLHERCEVGSEVERRFLTEARAATRPSHPNIVDVCNIGTTENGEPFLVMELLQGQDLAQILADQGPFSVERMATIVGQVCSALAAAHRAGIIHRDLKSENIMVVQNESEADFVKVLDFGICKQLNLGESSDSSPGLVVGSPDYMAPEQAVGGEVDGKSDIYALGTVMFEMLTGQLPFSGSNAVEVLTLKGSKDAPSLLELRPDLPPEVAQLVQRCLARDPSHRPATMRMVSYELIKATHDRPTAVAAHLGLKSSVIGGDEAFERAARESGFVGEVAAEDVESVPSGVQSGGEAFPPIPTPPPGPPPKSLAGVPGTTAAAPSTGFIASSGEPASQDISQPISQVGEWWDLRRTSSKLVALGCAVGCFALGAAISRGNSATQSAAASVPDSTAQGSGGQSTSTLGVKVDKSPNPKKVENKKAPPTKKVDVTAQAEAKKNEEQAPEPSPKAKRVEYWLKSAKQAFETQHWTTPPKKSLAVSLMNLSLLAPSRLELGTLRREAAKILLAKADTAFSQQNWNLAARSYRDLLAVAPDTRGASPKLARALGRWAKEALKSGDNATADRASAELLNKRPDSVDAHRLRATVLEAMLDIEGAAAEYRAIIRLDPGNRRAVKALRRVRKKQKKAARPK